MCIVWSQLAGIRTPPIVTTDFLYIRFIGDRTIQEKDFDNILIKYSIDTGFWIKHPKLTLGYTSSRA